MVDGAYAGRSLAPPAPPGGRRVRLEGRGRSYLRELSGPSGAPTLLLLHGWIASAALNWFQVFAPLARHFRVLAPDLRGHARGLRSWQSFRLDDCADDAAALLEQEGAGPAIVVGYSMGGAVAQLLWRRHPRLVSGLVLCATAPAMIPEPTHRAVFGTMMSLLAGGTRLGQLSAALPRAVLGAIAPEALAPLRRPTSWAADDFGRHEWRMLLEAGHELSSFDARPWIGQVDVPTAVLVTCRDRAMPPENQHRLARDIACARCYELDGGHTVCAHPAFAGPLVAACRDVAARAAAV